MYSPCQLSHPDLLYLKHSTECTQHSPPVVIAVVSRYWITNQVISFRYDNINVFFKH